MPLQTYTDPPHIERRFNQRRHDARASQLEAEENEARATSIRERREYLRESERLRHDENRQWEREGRTAHRTNMKIFKEGRSKDIALEMQVKMNRDSVKAQGNKNAMQSMDKGIDEFETNLRRLGIGTDPKKQEGKASFDEQDYISRIRQRKTEEVQGRKERTKRRQKMLLDQQRIYRSIYERQKQEQLLEKIMKQSKDERTIGEELQTQAQWRNVMVANRKFREAQYEARQALDEEDYKKLTSHSREREQEMYEISRSEELAKVNELVRQKEEKKIAKRRAICSEITEQVFDLSWKVIEFRERTTEFKSSILTGKPLVPIHTWKEWLLQFATNTGDVEPADELPDTLDDLKPPDEQSNTATPRTPQGEEDAEQAPGADADTIAKEKQFEVLKLLNEEETSKYVTHTGDWGTVAKPPSGSEYNVGLCNLISKVNAILHPAVPPVRLRHNTAFMFVSFIGKNLSGKSAAAKSVAEALDFSFVSCKDILTIALSSVAENGESLFSGLTDELKEIVTERVELALRAKNDELDKGNELSDDVLSRLVVNHFKWLRAHSQDTEVLKSPKGMLLEGFPRTANQLEIVEKLMTTYDPSITGVPESRLAPSKYATNEPVGSESLPPKAVEGEDAAVEPAEAAAEPAQPSAADEEVLTFNDNHNETAIDLVLNFNVSDAEVTVRYAGERVDPVTGRVYHLLYDPPPDEVLGRLQEVERTSCDSELVHSKLTSFRHHKKRIDAWLSRTGTLKDIDGTKSLAEVKVLALEAVQACVDAKAEYERKKRQKEELQKRLEEEAHKPEEVPKEVTEEQVDEEATAVDVPEPPLPDLPLPVSTEVASTVSEQWKEVVRVFEVGLSEVFAEMRKLKRESVEHFVMVTGQFKSFLAKPSSRQLKVDAFQDDFNAFDQEMRRDKDGMAELHLRADSLQNALWLESDSKKECAETVLADAAKSPWHDLFQGSVQSQFVALMELECSRFVFTKRIIQFFFSAVYCFEMRGEDAIPDLTLSATEEASKGKKVDKKAPPKGKPAGDTEEKQDEFTRTYRRALEWIDEMDDEKEKNPKAPLSEDGRELFAEALSKQIWEKEVELLRYRLEAICTKYYAFVEDVHVREGDVLSKLNSILQNVYHKEMGATSALLSYIRTSIEEQVSMEYSCSLTGSALVIDETSVLVSPTEPNTLHVPVSGDGGDFITPSVNREHVDGIVSRFKGRARGGLVSKDDFLRLFLQIAATSVGNDSIPECWLHFGKDTFQKAYSTFDWLDQGACDWRSFCVSLVLWSSESVGTKLWIGPPTLTELCDLKAAMCSEERTQLTSDEFMQTPFWFEKSVSDSRAEQVKQLLWDIFESTDEEGTSMVDAKYFLLYLCPDRQILRGEQKAFAIMSDEEGTVSAADVHRIFHYTPYTADNNVDDAYSRESIESLFKSITSLSEQSADRISFTQVCAWHVGRVMLSNAGAFLLHSVSFQ